MTNARKHTVRPGDTLSEIAARYGVGVAELQQANDLPDPGKISVGARLFLPAAPTRASAASTIGQIPLGSLSRAYEVSGDGPGRVSKGKGDRGGVSYGSYQLSSKSGRPAQFLDAEGKPWAAEFAGHEPGSAGFTRVWKAIAAREPDRFHAAQHAFIRRTHYDMQVRRIAACTGLDIDARGRALREAVWSVAVQHGPSSSLIAQVIAALGLEPTDAEFDKALIEAIYRERGRRDADGRLHHFRSSSAAFQDGVARRFRREVADALALLAAEQAHGTAARAARERAVEAIRKAPVKLSDDEVRVLVEHYGDSEANADFLAGRTVLLALRTSTNTRQHRTGRYDDLLLIARRRADGSVKLVRLPLNTEPAGEYAFDGTNRNRDKYGLDTDGDGRKELGRLVAGTYHYVRARGRFLGAEYFRSRDIQISERDTDQDGLFQPGRGDRLDPTGAGRSMHLHRGGPDGVATWSAGCQTVPKDHYSAFLAAVKGQDALSYILIDAG